jgi:hypothetical protein
MDFPNPWIIDLLEKLIDSQVVKLSALYET